MGLPEYIIDEPRMHFWKHGITLSMNNGDHPQTYGKSERVNPILEDMLRAYVSERQTYWDTYLLDLEFTYNNRSHLVTGSSLFKMNHSFPPMDLGTIGIPTHCPNMADFLTKMQQMLQIVKQKI